MTDKKIKFDRWWKKLKYSQGIFTTIRKYTKEKLKYYKDNIGEIFDIEVTDTRNGFKEFEKIEYIILIFEFVEVRKAKLLYAFVKSFDDLSKELIEYDTRE